jgi:hypothetical protein
MFILSLPIAISVTLGVVVASSFSIGLYFIAHRLWSGQISPETRRTADSVATRIGVIHAVVLGMMFTSVRVEYNDMIVAIESEASAITRLYHAMGRQGGETLDEARKHLADYIRFVVNVQWPALRELRFEPSDTELAGRDALNRVWPHLKMSKLSPVISISKNSSTRLKILGCRGCLTPLAAYFQFSGISPSSVTFSLL